MPLLGNHCPGWCLVYQPWGLPVRFCVLNQRSFHGGQLCSSSGPCGETQGSCRLPSLGQRLYQLPSSHCFQVLPSQKGLSGQARFSILKEKINSCSFSKSLEIQPTTCFWRTYKINVLHISHIKCLDSSLEITQKTRDSDCWEPKGLANLGGRDILFFLF